MIFVPAHDTDTSHVVRLTTYIVDMRDEPAQREALGGLEPPPCSLIGVASPAWPGMLIKVEATAVVPALGRPGRRPGAPDQPESVHKLAVNAQN